VIRITDTIVLDESEVQVDFIRASGPGGQRVNKVSTAVQLRFNVAESPTLTESVRQRLKKIAGRRMTAGGILIIKANRFRSQEQNRRDAVNRLVSMILKATQQPQQRHPTKPTAASSQRRLEAKRRQSETKHRRKPVQAFGDDV
jgi:ribosome-associated protein